MSAHLPVIRVNIILTRELVRAAANIYKYKSIWQQETGTGTDNPWLWNYLKHRYRYR